MEQLKADIVDYWTRRTEPFSALRGQELHSEKRSLWERELLRALPAGSELDILDVGTGSGFLAILLAAMGHRVTGIDMAPSMCRAAEEQARAAGVHARFLVMDAEAPALPAGSFDVIVSRNLTWNLPHLEQAYAAWYGLLKPGGVLINFDGDYSHERPISELAENPAHQAVCRVLRERYEAFKTELAQMQQLRPAWDQRLLEAAGFAAVTVDPELSGRIYPQLDAFYNPTPMFVLRAEKPVRAEKTLRPAEHRPPQAALSATGRERHV